MAINTDGPRAMGVPGESSTLRSDFGDTEKLLDASTKAELNRKDEKTAENVSSVPLSPSRVRIRRPPSPTPGDPEPCSFIWVAVISCFCPAVPINVFALYFAHLARSMIQSKDYEGGRKLGRLSLLLSIVSIVVGLAIVLYLVMTEIF